MSGNKVLLDMNVLIFASKQKLDVQALLRQYDYFYVSIITYMEVYAYEFQVESEKDLVDKLFGVLEVVDINRPIAEQAIIYRKNKAKKIKLPDAIILATAKHVGAELVTDDWDDFGGIDNQVVVTGIDHIKK